MSESHNNKQRPPSSKTKKGSINIIRAALHMLKKQKNNNGSSKPNNNNKPILSESTNTALTNIIGSVRPLYLQSNVGDMPSPDRYETVSQSSSTSSSTSRSSSQYDGGMMSKYASAQSLSDLDSHDIDAIVAEDNNDNDTDSYYDGLEGDELIDTKAELFISNFYQQMRLQN